MCVSLSLVCLVCACLSEVVSQCLSGLYLEQQISLEASGAASMHAVRAIAAQAYGAPGKVKAAFAAESSSAGTIAVAKAKAVS